MIRRIGFAVAIIFLALAFSATTAVVRENFTLKRVAPEKQAIGEVTVKQTGPVRSDRILGIDVFRLKPNSIYSVWLVHTRYDNKRVPAGLTGQNFLKTDGSGNAHYSDYTDEYKLDWTTVEIAYHPDGDIKNTKDMVVVLTTRLY